MKLFISAFSLPVYRDILRLFFTPEQQAHRDTNLDFNDLFNAQVQRLIASVSVCTFIMLVYLEIFVPEVVEILSVSPSSTLNGSLINLFYMIFAFMLGGIYAVGHKIMSKTVDLRRGILLWMSFSIFWPITHIAALPVIFVTIELFTNSNIDQVTEIIESLVAIRLLVLASTYVASMQEKLEPVFWKALFGSIIVILALAVVLGILYSIVVFVIYTLEILPR